MAQDFTDFELVVCDDGSTDDTPQVVSGYRDRRVRSLRFQNGGGQSANFNRCINEARGEFVLLLHADDYLLPGYLSARVDQLMWDNSRVLAAGGTVLVDDEGVEQGIDVRFSEDRDFPDGAFVRELMLQCLIVPVSMVFRREAARRAGPFRTDIVWGPDWEWALRLAALGGVHYDATPRAAYRVHSGSGTASAIGAGRNGPQERMILDEVFARLKVDARFAGDLPALRQRAGWFLGLRHMAFAEELLGAGKNGLARANLGWARRAAPALLTRPTYWAMLVGTIMPAGAFRAYRKLRPGRSKGSGASAVKL